MNRRIILSYRRSDSDVITGRIRDKLAGRYGDDAVFMDIENIPLGFDYRRQIKAALLENRVFVAVIGPKWLGGSGAEARINEDNDPVRIEVETALQQGLPVVPVLVSGAAMPKASDLPPSLQSLCYLNAAEVDGGRDFHQDMDRLIKAIDQILKTTGGASSSPRRKWLPVTAGVAACVILAAIAVWAYPFISEYFRSKDTTQVAVQTSPSSQPAPTAQSPSPAASTAPVPQATPSGPASPPIVTPPPATQATPAPAPQASPPPQAAAAPLPEPQPAPTRGLPSLTISTVPPPAFNVATCKPETASFHDNFRKPDAGWNFTPNEQAHYANDQLVVTPQQGRSYSLLYPALRYQNATVCAHLKSPPQVTNPRDAVAGVIFWAANYDNYYVAELVPDGSYAIYRRLARVWIPVVPLTKDENLKTGVNAENEISVQVVDNFAALFINGVKVREFRGQPPDGGAAVGLYAEAEASLSDEWHFLDIAVMDNGNAKQVVLPPSPSGPTIADCRLLNSNDFQDTFAVPDPAWGVSAPASQYVDSQLVLKPGENSSEARLYRPLVFRKATVCVTVESPPDLADIEQWSSAGIAFWAKDYRNYYVAKIFPNGTFNVSRYFNAEWATVVGRTGSDAIKKGFNAVNSLQIVLNDANALLYINGTKVSEFRGQPPAEGGTTGLFAQSEDHKQNDWRFLGITVVENK